MILLKSAIDRISELRKTYYFRKQSESIPIEQAMTRELSAAIKASKMSPEFDIATMDGYAIQTDHEFPLQVKQFVYAGDPRGASLALGQTAAIATGAFMPHGSNAVIKLEDATISKDVLSGPAITPWTNVFRAGADYRAGDVILTKGQNITPQAMALLHGLCVNEVEVYKKIRVGIISTGTEIHKKMVRNTNAVMACAFLKEWGCDAEFIGTVPDDYDLTQKIIMQAASEYDVVVTTGGVSVGEKDYVHRVITNAGKMIFHKIAIRPGKPLAVGVVDGTLVFGLPGKPTGAFAAMELVIRHFFKNVPRPSITANMAQNVSIPNDGCTYVLFVKNGPAGLQTMGYEDTDLSLFSARNPYDASLVSASPRSSVVDGYVVTDHGIVKGDTVTVNLFG